MVGPFVIWGFEMRRGWVGVEIEVEVEIVPMIS